jgi:hypothetical protein
MSISKIIPIIPNPFDKDSKLSDLAKKEELIEEGFSFGTLIKNIIFLIILGFVLIVYFKISTTIIAILIGTQILVTLISGYIKIKKIEAIYSIDTQDNGKSYRNLLITKEYWELIRSIFGVITNIISVALIFIFFSSEISNFVIQNDTLNLLIKTDLLKYIILVFVVFSTFEFIIKLIRYNLIKNIKESNNFAQVNKEYVIIKKKLNLIKYIPGMSLLLFIMFLIGVPIEIFLIFTGLTLLSVIFGIVEIKRIKDIQFDDKGIDNSVVQHKIESYQNEQIVGVIFGIMRTATDLKDMFNLMGESFLGVGKTYFPENSLLITNYRLLMIQVPVSGGNKIVDETDYVSLNFFFNRAEIREKGEEILKTSSISEILNLAINDVLFEDVKRITLNKTQLIIEKSNGEKLGYVFMDRENIEPLKNILSFYLKDKFIVK